MSEGRCGAGDSALEGEEIKCTRRYKWGVREIKGGIGNWLYGKGERLVQEGIERDWYRKELNK